MLVSAFRWIINRKQWSLIESIVYAIEATVHAPTWEGVYGEIFKVLKPGGVVRLFFSTSSIPANVSNSSVSTNGA